MPRLLTLALVALSAGCGGLPSRQNVHQRLPEMSDGGGSGGGRFDADVVGTPAPFEVRDVAIHGDRRPSAVLEAPARITFLSDGIGAPYFRFGLAIRPPGADVTMSLNVNGKLAHEEAWAEERDWVQKTLDLSAFSNEPMELELSFEGEGTVMLAHPEILGRADDPARPNVIVYVIDCLRADRVGAYGYELPTTPAIDAFAQAVDRNQDDGWAGWVSGWAVKHPIAPNRCYTPGSAMDALARPAHRGLSRISFDVAALPLAEVHAALEPLTRLCVGHDLVEKRCGVVFGLHEHSKLERCPDVLGAKWPRRDRGCELRRFGYDDIELDSRWQRRRQRQSRLAVQGDGAREAVIAFIRRVRGPSRPGAKGSAQRGGSHGR